MAKTANTRFMSMTLRVVVPPHPLIAHWLTVLRSASTPPSIYSTGLEELGKWLTYEALREWLPHRSALVETPLAKTEGKVIESRVPLLALPILPVGIELWQGARRVLPNAQLCLGKVPIEIEENAGVIVFIDQIASGENLSQILKALNYEKVDANRIRVVTALASTPGLKRIGESFPEQTIYCACIDPELTDEGEIRPGIGNPLLRLNTRTKFTN